MITIARNVKFSFLKGSGSNLEVLFGKVTLTPTNMHMLSSSAVLPAPTTYDLINGVAVATGVVPTPAPVDGKIAWAYVVKVTDSHGKTFEYMVGVPDGTTEINFNVLPRYFETKPESWGVGPAGPAGTSATVAVGTVTSGTTPNVVNSGTNTNAVLDFTLAKGDKGDTGAGVPSGGTALQVIRKNAGNTSTEWVTLDKTTVGLSNVDNTSDLNKPVSTATQSAIEVVLSGEDSRISALVNDSDSQTSESLRNKFVDNNFLVVAVDDFGALGDGSQDDTDAIQQAATYIKDHGGGTLFFSPGKTYLVLGSVELGHGTTVHAYGAVLKKKSPNNGYSVFVTRSHGDLGYGSGGSNLIFAGGTYEGSFDANVSGIAVTLHHSENVVFRDIVFAQAVVSGHAIDLGGCRGITVTNCQFNGWRVSAGKEYTEAIQLDYSTAQAMGGVEFVEGAYDGLPTTNVTVTHNTFQPTEVGGAEYPSPNPIGNHNRVEGMWIENVVFADNTVVGGRPTSDLLEGMAEYFQGWVHLFNARNVAIERNSFIGTTNMLGTTVINSRTPSTGTLLAEVNLPNPVSKSIPLLPPTNFVVRGNTFEGFNAPVNTRMINILGASAARARVLVVEGNTVLRCTPTEVGEYTPAAQTLVFSQDIDGVVLRGNTINGVGQALYFYRGTSLEISGNSVLRTTKIFSQVDACDRVTMVGNTISYGGGMWFRAVDTVIQADNILTTYYSDVGDSLSANMVAFTGCNKLIVRDNHLNNISGNTRTVRGFHVYGSSRTGVLRGNMLVGDFITAPIVIETNSSTVVESGTIIATS